MASEAGIDLAYPFTGDWLVQNSPANRIPSHGTTLFATSYAIDFVPVGANQRTAPITLASLLRPDPPERFPGFGRPILSPIDGIVTAVHDAEPDHPAYRGIPSIGYALTQARRASAGWTALAGNHVVIAVDDVRVVLCHLQQRSVSVAVGQRVSVGEPIGRCGNSGNSTEPHLHLQAVSGSSIETASAVPVTFGGTVPRNRERVRRETTERQQQSENREPE